MKMARKIIAVLMALLVCLMSMAVYATETEHVHEGCCGGEIEPAAVVPGDEAIPYVDRCSNCGTGRLRTRTDTESDMIDYKCGHNGETDGRDYYIETRYYTVYYCSNNCGSGESRVYVDSSLAFFECSNGHALAPFI